MLGIKKASLMVLISLALISCAVGPNFKPAAAPAIPGYTEKPLPSHTVSAPTKSGGNSQEFLTGADIPGQWWSLFHSPALDVLICQGMANSPNIDAAEAALREARQNYLAQVGNLFPAIDSNFTAQRQKFSGQTLGAAGSSIFNLYNASVNVSYTLDVFGGIRRQIEAQAALVDYQQFQLEAAYLSLTANIVTAAITEASLRQQIIATHQLIDGQQKQLDILQKQFQLGAVSLVDVLTQQTEVAQTTATLPPLEKNLAETRNLLAALVGTFPSAIHIPEFDLDKLTLPKELPVSLPGNLIRQRPDIQAQEALVHQASALIGVATANMLPQFTITGNYGFTSNSLNTLFNSESNVWLIAGQIAQPIFQGGTLLAQRRSAIAAYDQAVAQYRKTVVTAVENVADALRALELDAIALRAQRAAETAAYQTLTISQQQYKLGGLNYLNILVAERQYQTSRINRIKAQAARYADTAALFQALGGGWWNRPSVIPAALHRPPLPI